MHIHRLSPDIEVQKKANHRFNQNKPTAISEFSLVELKGNYIACLILMRRKIDDSDSLGMAYSRISNSGGRRPQMMLAQLVRWLDAQSYALNQWGDIRNALLTFIDSQIESIWEYFKASVDFVASDFNCTRANEEPQDNNGKWSATIHRCNKSNSDCTIEDFITNFLPEIKKLVTFIQDLSETETTKELQKIQLQAEKVVAKSKFFRGDNRCRQIGDLIIGLHSKLGLKLISSNYKEHGKLSQALDYKYEQFDIAAIRSK